MYVSINRRIPKVFLLPRMPKGASHFDPTLQYLFYVTFNRFLYALQGYFNINHHLLSNKLRFVIRKKSIEVKWEVFLKSRSSKILENSKKSKKMQKFKILDQTWIFLQCWKMIKFTSKSHFFLYCSFYGKILRIFEFSIFSKIWLFSPLDLLVSENFIVYTVIQTHL